MAWLCHYLLSSWHHQLFSGTISVNLLQDAWDVLSKLPWIIGAWLIGRGGRWLLTAAVALIARTAGQDLVNDYIQLHFHKKGKHGWKKI